METLFKNVHKMGIFDSVGFKRYGYIVEIYVITALTKTLLNIKIITGVSLYQNRMRRTLK